MTFLFAVKLSVDKIVFGLKKKTKDLSSQLLK